jgi:hypothetical protein
MLLISPQPRSAHSCTVDLGMPGSGCVAHICSGERPLAMPLPITEALRAAPSSASPMPRLASEGSASAAPCACDARQNTCGPPSGRSRRARGTRCSASATRPAWGTSRPGRPAPARPPWPSASTRTRAGRPRRGPSRATCRGRTPSPCSPRCGPAPSPWRARRPS